MFSTLRTRLIISYAFVVLVCVGVIGLALLVLLRTTGAVGRIDYLNLSVAIRSVDLSRQVLLPRNGSTPQVAERLVLIAEEFDLRVLLLNEDGHVLLDSAVLQHEAPEGDLGQLWPAGRSPDGNRPAVRDSRNRLWLFVVRPLGQRGLWLAFLRRPSTALQFLREYLLAPLLLATLAGIGLSILMAFGIAYWVSGPLRTLTRAAGEIAKGNYDQRVPLSGPRDVQVLAQSFNEMAAQVDSSRQAQHDLIANVSHELKTPLTSVQGYSQAILDDLGDDPAAVKRFAHVINDEAERMRRLVAGLLDLARLSAGQSALQREPTDVQSLLHSVSEKLQLRAQQQQVDLGTKIGALPVMIVDPDRLAQVFTNLVENAIKHTPGGGSVSLSAEQRDGQVHIAVTDSGQGIPEKDLSRIFERFYMVDKSRKAGTGYGLGLAISREIVVAHGGTIRVQSIEGVGTKFIVQLPVVWHDDATLVRRRK